MQNKCIFFFDFDNTLYSHQCREIPSGALEALGTLREQGHIVVVISGRGSDSLPLFRSSFDRMPDTVCLLNGQMIYHNNALVYAHPLEQMDALTLFETARKHQIIYGGYNADRLIISGANDRVRAVWKDFGAEPPMVKPDLEKTDAIYQACLYLTEEERPFFNALLDHYVTNWSHHYLCNLISRDAGKAVSVQWCLQYFGISRGNAYAFGDGYNDMDLLAAVGHGIAMENGFPPLRKMAEYVAAAPENDGIRLALQHYGFLSGAGGRF